MHKKAFGKHLKLTCSKQHLKPKVLAKKAGLNIETIRSAESGKRAPSIFTLIAISNALEVSPEYLLSADCNQTLLEAKQKYPELFDLIFDLTYPEKKRLEDTAKVMIKQRKK